MKMMILMVDSNMDRNVLRRKVWGSLSPRNGATTAIWLTQSSAATTSNEPKTLHTPYSRLTTATSLTRSSAPQTSSTRLTTSRARCSSATVTACKHNTIIIISTIMKEGSVWARVIESSLWVVRSCSRWRIIIMIMSNKYLRRSISSRLLQWVAVRPKLRIGGNFSVKMSSIGLINCR